MKRLFLIFAMLAIGLNAFAYDTTFQPSMPSMDISSDSDAVDVSESNIVFVDTSGGNVTIGGLSGGVNVGQTVRIIKSSAANDMVIEHDESTGTEKFLLAEETDETYDTVGGLIVTYNGTYWVGHASTYSTGSASTTLDGAYNNDTGERTITVDDGDVSWDIDGDYDFVIDLVNAGDPYGAPNGVLPERGFHVNLGTDYFALGRLSDNNMDLRTYLNDFYVSASDDVQVSSTSFTSFTSGASFTVAADTYARIDADTTARVRAGASSDLTLGARGQDVTLNESGDTSLDTTSQSLIGAINEVLTGSGTSHNDLSGLQGGTAGSYYHSDQDINTTASPSFVNATLSGKTAGSVLFSGAGGVVSEDNASIFWDDTNDYLGIGINTPTDRVGIQSAGGTTLASLGSTLLTNGDFATDLSSWTAGAGWSWSTGTALHTAGNTATLTQGISVTSAAQYQYDVTVSGRTAGSLGVSFPGSDESYSLTTNAAHSGTFKAGSTASIALTFTPTTDFDGALDGVTFKLITPASTYDFSLYDTAGNRSGLAASAGDSSLNNSSIGVGAGVYNTLGAYNSNQGFYSGFFNTLGSFNTNQGYYSGYENTTGTNNSNQGHNSGRLNRVGSFNSNQGARSGYSNVSGSNNTNQGYYSARLNVSGSNNSNQGAFSGYSNVSGSNNSCQGYRAGRYTSSGGANETSSYCTMIGANTRVDADGDTNETAIGNGAVGIGSNTVTLGNSAVTQTRIGGVISTVNGGASSNYEFDALSMGHDTGTDDSWFQSAGAADQSTMQLNPEGGDIELGANVTIKENASDYETEIDTGSIVTEHTAPVTLADDASFDLPVSSAGFGTFHTVDDDEVAIIIWDRNATVTILTSNGSVVNTDTDTNFCLFDNGTSVRVRNRLGASKDIIFDYNYTTPF